MVEEMAAPAPKVAQRVSCTSEHLARVLYLHECLGGDMATFARVTGLHEEAIRTIVENARGLPLL